MSRARKSTPSSRTFSSQPPSSPSTNSTSKPTNGLSLCGEEVIFSFLIIAFDRNVQPRLNRRNTGSNSWIYSKGLLMHTQRFRQNPKQLAKGVPSMSVMGGPLEPSLSTITANEPREGSSLVNYLAAMNIGGNTSNMGNSRPTYPSPATAPPYSYAPSVVTSPSPSPLVPALTFSASSTQTPLPCTSDLTPFIKPSSFFPLPASSSSGIVPPIASAVHVPTAGALHPPVSLQRSYGTPLLQSFPPPAPPASLTSNASPTLSEGPYISREKFREALLMLVQVDQFVDMFYQALRKVHQT